MSLWVSYSNSYTKIYGCCCSCDLDLEWKKKKSKINVSYKSHWHSAECRCMKIQGLLILISKIFSCWLQEYKRTTSLCYLSESFLHLVITPLFACVTQKNIHKSSGKSSFMAASPYVYPQSNFELQQHIFSTSWKGLMICLCFLPLKTEWVSKWNGLTINCASWTDTYILDRLE